MKRFLAAAAAFAAAPALAQSNIDPAHAFCWQENTGWLNWRSAGSPTGTQGVHAYASYFAGYAWGENIGFINFGDGSPANGSSYANTTGADFGVNILPNGDLGGMAWGENVGWINFGTAAFLAPAQRARLDAGAARLRGWAWGENIGWLDLDDAAAYIGVQSACYANCDNSTLAPILNVNDFICFQAKFAAGDAYANCDQSTMPPILNVNDYICFQAKFAAGCP
jgi:hypothetical protein